MRSVRAALHFLLCAVFLGVTPAVAQYDPQAAFAPYHRQIRPVLNIPDEEIVVCGMALGHEDTSKPENDFRTDRVPLEEWVTFSE